MPKPTLRAKRRATSNLYFETTDKANGRMSTGCGLLDCVLGGGYGLGRITNIVGDKSTGKTLLAIEAMVQFLRNFKTGLAAYCETEAAFDDAYAASLGLPIKKVLRPECSTVEDLFEDMQTFINKCKEQDVPGLYIVDSLDALSDKAEQDRKITDSTYGASKPKQLGQLFRRLVKPLEQTKVLVIIISQVRDAIGVTFGNKHTRSGGRALDFYASQIIWLAHIGQMHRTVNKIKRAVGVHIKAKTSKNKLGLPFRECQFDILFNYGIDDIAAGLAFLKDSGKLEELGIGATDKAIAGFRKTFMDADHADQKEMRDELNRVVQEAWDEIEQSFAPVKGKYV